MTTSFSMWIDSAIIGVDHVFKYNTFVIVSMSKIFKKSF